MKNRGPEPKIRAHFARYVELFAKAGPTPRVDRGARGRLPHIGCGLALGSLMPGIAGCAARVRSHAAVGLWVPFGAYCDQHIS